MEIRQPLTIDLALQLPALPVPAVQGDGNTRVLEITLLENGAPWQIPESAVADVAFRKPDGTKGIYSRLPDGSTAAQAVGNVLRATMAPQMLTCPGSVLATVVFRTDGGKTLAAFPFTVAVAANPAAGAQLSEDYFNPTQISDLRAELAAGLATKAPAGYGLGGYSQEISGKDIDTITVGGSYWWQNATNAPFSWGYMTVAPANGDSYCTQTIYNMLDVCAVRRTKTNAGWITEWVNPPMQLGVEYRTTERYLGKPVYCQLVSAGNLPSATTRTINTIELTNPIYYILSVHGRTTVQNRTIPHGEYVSVRGGYGNITLETTVDYSDDAAELVVKYYKPYE